MKGQVWAYAGIVIVILLSSFALIKINATGNVKRIIASSEGKLIAFENYAELIIRTFNSGIEFISQRSAYDLGERGGMEESLPWNTTYPSLDLLKTELENKISENLPNTPTQDGRSISWGDAYIGVLDYDDAICGPIENSKCFIIDGTKSFSIYDRSIDSRISLNPYKFNQKIESNYFRLINAGRAIMEDQRFNTKLNDLNSLLDEINAAKSEGDSRFKDLDVLVTPPYDITIEEKCSAYYCLAPLKPGETGELAGIPYDYLKLKFRLGTEYLLTVNASVDGYGLLMPDVPIKVDSITKEDSSGAVTFLIKSGSHSVSVPVTVNGREFTHFWDRDCNQAQNGYTLDTASNPYNFEIFNRNRAITALYKIFTRITDLSYSSGAISGKLSDEKGNEIYDDTYYHSSCSIPAEILHPNKNVTLEYYDGSWNKITTINTDAVDFSYSWTCHSGATKIRARYDSLNWYYMSSINETSVSC